MARRNALALPYRHTASKISMIITTIPIFGNASVQPDRISGRTASIAQVIGLNFARKLIQAGIACSGTSAELRKIIGSDRNPRTEKKSPWLLTEKASAIEM